MQAPTVVGYDSTACENRRVMYQGVGGDSDIAKSICLAAHQGHQRSAVNSLRLELPILGVEHPTLQRLYLGSPADCLCGYQARHLQDGRH